MKIAFYTIGDADVPSTRFRVFQYLPKFQEAGISVDVLTLPRTGKGRLEQFLLSLWQGFVRRQQLEKVSQYDLVIVQKGLTPWRCRGLVEKLVSSGVPFIFDMDDAVYLKSDIRLPLFFSRWQDDQETLKLLRQARHIVVGNPILEAFAKEHHESVTLIPTVLDTDRYYPDRQEGDSKPLVIGWSGTASTNAYVNCLIPVLQKLRGQYGFTFHIMSHHLDSIDVSKLAGIPFQFIRWSRERELESLRKIDIGVMPLPDNEWTRGKCGAKALLYMSLGIPAVCSPVGVNQEIIQDGINGFLAANEKEWFEKLALLLENAGLRRQMGEKARQTVEMEYSVGAHFPKWLHVVEEAKHEKMARC